MGWPDRAGLDRAGGMLERWRQKREKTSDFKLQLLLQGLAENKAEGELEKSRDYDLKTYQTREAASLEKYNAQQAARLKSSAQTFDLQQKAREEQAARIWGQQRSEARQGSQEGAANAAALARRPGYLELLASLTPAELKIRADKNFDQRPVQMQDGQPVPGRSVEEMLAEVAALQTKKSQEKDVATAISDQRAAYLLRTKLSNMTPAELNLRNRRAAGDERPEELIAQEYQAALNRANELKMAQNEVQMEEARLSGLEQVVENFTGVPGATAAGMNRPGSLAAYAAAEFAGVLEDTILGGMSFVADDQGIVTFDPDATDMSWIENQTVGEEIDKFSEIEVVEDFFSPSAIRNANYADSRQIIMEAGFGKAMGQLEVQIEKDTAEAEETYKYIENGNDMMAILLILGGADGYKRRSRVLAGMISAKLNPGAGGALGN
jgi:hypothetical protein